MKVLIKLLVLQLEPCSTSISCISNGSNKQERPLGQRKTPPANKLHNVTSRLMSNTTGKYIFTGYRYSISQYLNDLDFDLSRSLKVKPIVAIRLPTYGFLLMFNCNIGSNSAPLQDIRLRNLSDLEFDLSRSLKVKSDGVIGLQIYGFQLMVNSNLLPNFAPLRDMRL